MVGAHLTGISNQSQEDELSGQICLAELASNQLLFVDLFVGVKRCIGLTGNKLLYPVRREAISPAPVGFRRGGSKIYSEHFPFEAGHHVVRWRPGFFSRRTHGRIQVPAATTGNNGRKNRGGRSTACELVMNLITLTDKPLWSAEMSFQVKNTQSLKQKNQQHTGDIFTQPKHSK